MKSTVINSLNSGAIIKKIEFLGVQKLPYRMKYQESYAYEGR